MQPFHNKTYLPVDATYTQIDCYSYLHTFQDLRQGQGASYVLKYNSLAAKAKKNCSTKHLEDTDCVLLA